MQHQYNREKKYEWVRVKPKAKRFKIDERRQYFIRVQRNFLKNQRRFLEAVSKFV